MLTSPSRAVLARFSRELVGWIRYVFIVKALQQMSFSPSQEVAKEDAKGEENEENQTR